MAGESNRIRNKKMGEEEEKPLPRIVPKGSGVYYSNCALVTSSHRELSVLFGRIGPAEGVTGLAEVYERHIYMTVEQAIDVARAILMTAQKFQENRKILEDVWDRR